MKRTFCLAPRELEINLGSLAGLVYCFTSRRPLVANATAEYEEKL